VSIIVIGVRENEHRGPHKPACFAAHLSAKTAGAMGTATPIGAFKRLQVA